MYVFHFQSLTFSFSDFTVHFAFLIQSWANLHPDFLIRSSLINVYSSFHNLLNSLCSQFKSFLQYNPSLILEGSIILYFNFSHRKHIDKFTEFPNILWFHSQLLLTRLHIQLLLKLTGAFLLRFSHSGGRNRKVTIVFFIWVLSRQNCGFGCRCALS